MNKNLNRNVADFKYKDKYYEVDLLLDSICNGYQSYDIFDVSNNKRGIVVGQFTLEEGEYVSSEIIEKAKEIIV